MDILPTAPTYIHPWRRIVGEDVASIIRGPHPSLTNVIVVVSVTPGSTTVAIPLCACVVTGVKTRGTRMKAAQGVDGDLGDVTMMVASARVHSWRSDCCCYNLLQQLGWGRTDSGLCFFQHRDACSLCVSYL